MADARLDQVRVDFAAPDGGAGLRASGSTVAFDGFLAVYAEGRDDAAGDEDEERRLPKVEQGDAMTLGAVDPAQHFTEPPPRYTEASLVRKMEELGIGRPSTYAGIVSVLQDRGYVKLERKRFLPEDRGRLVTAFLANFFETYVRYDFTARLEDQLDQISNGDVEWKSVLSAFWSGFSAAVEDIGGLGVRQILDTLDEALAPHIFPEPENGAADANPRACPKCGDGRLGLKLGRYGAFVGCSNYPECRYTRQLAASGANGAAAADDGPRTLGQDANGTDVTVRKGPYGHYVQLGEAADDAKPKRTSVPKGTDAATIELPTALALLDLPRDIGAHPETGKTISAGIGRYGPYLRHDGAYKSLGAGDDVLTVGLNRAVILLAAPARGRGRAPAVPLKVLGKHPDDGVEVAVFEGRYGPLRPARRGHGEPAARRRPRQRHARADAAAAGGKGRQGDEGEGRPQAARRRRIASGGRSGENEEAGQERRRAGRNGRRRRAERAAAATHDGRGPARARPADARAGPALHRDRGRQGRQAGDRARVRRLRRRPRGAQAPAARHGRRRRRRAARPPRTRGPGRAAAGVRRRGGGARRRRRGGRLSRRVARRPARRRDSRWRRRPAAGRRHRVSATGSSSAAAAGRAPSSSARSDGGRRASSASTTARATDTAGSSARSSAGRAAACASRTATA